MDRYYCRPIKLYVCLVIKQKEYLEVLLFGHTNGVLLFPITMPFPSGRKLCAYINSKDYPWLYGWLIEKDLANPTSRFVLRNNFSYPEFKFKKEK